MKLTIIPADKAVYKDGYSYSGLDLSDFPQNVHALQWDGESGWVEFKDESEFRRPPNENIVVLPDWALAAKAKWEEAYVAQQAAELATKQAAELAAKQ